MTKEEFQEQFGMTPEKCREIMDAVANLVTCECQEVIAQLEYYQDPLDYDDEDDLKEHYGEEALVKEETECGYPNLYNYRVDHTAAGTFQRLISYHTNFGGFTSAMEACQLMGIKWRDGI